MVSCSGHPWLRTPHIDRLAAGGVHFRNSFVTTSLCSPSRASMLTGQYAHAHGVTDNFQVLSRGTHTFAQLLAPAGYRTAFIGKWHMGDPLLEGKNVEADNSDIPQPGWQRWISFRGQGVYRDPLLNFDGTRRKVAGYITDILNAEAIRFLEQQTPSQPFLLYLSHKAVHAGFTPAERHAKLYLDEAVPVPRTAANTEENYRGKPDWLRRKRSSRHGLDNVKLEEQYRKYCRTLMAVDESVGAVYETLRRRNLLDNTLILYAGDNGFLFGEHGLTDKRVMYEPSMRIPLIAHCPALCRSARRPEELALNIDICPTVLDAAGLPIPAAVHGRSLLPLIRGGAHSWRTEFLYEYFWDYEALHTPTVLGLRTDRYSYMSYRGIWDIDELYDVAADPDQTSNLLGDVRVTTQPGGLVQNIRDPELRARVRGFRARMADILRSTGGRFRPAWSDLQ
jgi:N-acetylglucosamine-6-sulfatase